MRGILHFLDNDSAFGRICTFVGSLVVVNFLFVIMLVPVFTAGAGLCGLYYAMLKLVRYKEINPVAEFWRGFCDNFKKATLTVMALLVMGVFLAVDLRICSFMTGPLQYCSTVVYGAIIALIVLAMYLFPVMAAFEGNIKHMLKLCVYFAGGNLPGTMAIAVLNIVPIVLTYINSAMLPLAAFLWCLCGFAVVAFCNSMIMMRRFSHYLKPVEDEQQSADRRRILEEMKMLEG